MIPGKLRTSALVARQGRFIAVYPQEDPDNGAQAIWNWGAAAYAGRSGRAPSLVAELTRRVIADHRADPRRVRVSGFSAGGAMAVGVGCMYAGLQCNPTTPYPNSTLDPDISAQEAYQAMGTRARRVPLLVSYGTIDPIDGMFHAYSGGAPLDLTDITVDPTGPNMRAVAWQFFERQLADGGSSRCAR